MPVTFHRSTLRCGLTVLAETDPDAHTAAAGFFVRTGARDEPSRDMGVSHFLEHMMFKGTARRTAAELNRDFDRIGGRSNAFTTAEMTAFHAAVLPERLPAALDILADMLRPALRADDFQTEKGVILEEIAMYKDNPFWVLYERAMEEHYGAHPLAHRVLGTTETITALGVDTMRDYFQRRYSADNTAVALAGRVDVPRAIDELERLCEGWARTAPRRDHPPATPGGRTFELRDDKVSRAYLIMFAPAPAMGDERRYAASLLAHILGGPDNSRLHWALIEPGLAEEAESAYDPRDGVGDYLLYASCDPGRADEVRAAIEAQIGTLRDSIVQDDVDRMRARVATGVTLAGERPEGRMQRIGRQWAYLDTHSTLEEELARINAVTVEQLRRVFDEFPMTPRTVGTLRPA